VAAFAERVVLGRTQLAVSRIGVAASYGLGARGVLAAADRGVNAFYWGSWRRADFGRGLAELLRRDRDRTVLAVQSYARIRHLLPWSVERALARLAADYADLLILGLWNAPVDPGVLEAAERLRERGRVRHVMISCHRRATFAAHASEPRVGALMVRYNAAHPGAESDAFPGVRASGAGVAAYTATCWGRLLDPSRLPQGEVLPRASDCYRFTLSHPAVHMTWCGPRDAAELSEALAALERGPMDAAELAWMKRVGAGSR
jgi:aryl-alcohol dehydrogenase-like predicted oxidoreductase